MRNEISKECDTQFLQNLPFQPNVSTNQPDISRFKLHLLLQTQSRISAESIGSDKFMYTIINGYQITCFLETCNDSVFLNFN